MMPTDLTGKTFGRLRVLHAGKPYQSGTVTIPRWVCLCDPARGGCGKTCLVRTDALLTGASQSCGCMRREWARDRRLQAARVWTPEEDALLGTDRDAVIAERIGVSLQMVSLRRKKLGVPSWASGRPPGRIRKGTHRPLAPVVCQSCGKTFDPRFSHQRACSPACRRELQQARKRVGRRVGPLPERVCPICGSNFAPIHNNHRICAESCRVEAERRKTADTNT